MFHPTISHSLSLGNLDCAQLPCTCRVRTDGKTCRVAHSMQSSCMQHRPLSPFLRWQNRDSVKAYMPHATRCSHPAPEKRLIHVRSWLSNFNSVYIPDAICEQQLLQEVAPFGVMSDVSADVALVSCNALMPVLVAIGFNRGSSWIPRVNQ